MRWFFERDDQSLRLETRCDNETSEFVAAVRYPNGREQIERFSTLDEFRSWVTVFDRNLEAQRWVSRSGPVVLTFGWPNKPLT